MIHKKPIVLSKRLTGFVLLFLLAVSFLAPVLPAQSPASPAIMVLVRCKSGTADLYQAALEKEIIPSIQEAISKGDSITKFSYFQAALPGQPVDFVLLFEVKTLGGLDTKRPWPHYVALFRRVGSTRGAEILTEMTSWEQDVKVTIVHTHTGQP